MAGPGCSSWMSPELMPHYSLPGLLAGLIRMLHACFGLQLLPLAPEELRATLCSDPDPDLDSYPDPDPDIANVADPLVRVIWVAVSSRGTAAAATASSSCSSKLPLHVSTASRSATGGATPLHLYQLQAEGRGVVAIVLLDPCGGYGTRYVRYGRLSSRGPPRPPIVAVGLQSGTMPAAAPQHGCSSSSHGADPPSGSDPGFQDPDPDPGVQGLGPAPDPGLLIWELLHELGHALHLALTAPVLMREGALQGQAGAQQGQAGAQQGQGGALQGQGGAQEGQGGVQQGGEMGPCSPFHPASLSGLGLPLELLELPASFMELLALRWQVLQAVCTHPGRVTCAPRHPTRVHPATPQMCTPPPHTCAPRHPTRVILLVVNRAPCPLPPLL